MYLQLYFTYDCSRTWPVPLGNLKPLYTVIIKVGGRLMHQAIPWIFYVGNFWSHPFREIQPRVNVVLLNNVFLLLWRRQNSSFFASNYFSFLGGKFPFTHPPPSEHSKWAKCEVKDLKGCSQSRFSNCVSLLRFQVKQHFCQAVLPKGLFKVAFFEQPFTNAAILTAFIIEATFIVDFHWKGTS